ncbi:tRNA (5-methylaminomethyl-2-thiouridine)(34)-methyltransferase MnmD [Deinococcus navajonensis]|uniref:tRNA (5-methylaminomethyl-2-thiouridine)(34)-methyltransferase MnmD n=1 Tax=Deinococcus navajonensis TaxID=309884 RepID=A0ABV8XTF0_9DEIO
MSESRAFTEAPILDTPDGSRTAYNTRFGEAYGSRHGAAAQARHVFVEGTGTHVHPAPRVLEVGFGIGVNARATLASAARRGAPLHYLAYEFDPAPREVLAEVARHQEGNDHPAWQALLDRWPQPPLETEAGGARLNVLLGDVLEAELPAGWATALYLDGFSPARNPEVWTPAFAARLARTLAPGGVLATYSAAGHVRRALQAAGLDVERRPGPPGKRECLRAVRPA